MSRFRGYSAFTVTFNLIVWLILVITTGTLKLRLFRMNLKFSKMPFSDSKIITSATIELNADGFSRLILVDRLSSIPESLSFNSTFG